MPGLAGVPVEVWIDPLINPVDRLIGELQGAGGQKLDIACWIVVDTAKGRRTDLACNEQGCLGLRDTDEQRGSRRAGHQS